MDLALTVLVAAAVIWLAVRGISAQTQREKVVAYIVGGGALVLIGVQGYRNNQVQQEIRGGIAALTGRAASGESFAYVVPQPHDSEGNVPLAIRSVGANSLSGVKLTIRDASPDTPIDHKARTLEVGVLPRDTIRRLEGVAIKASRTPGRRVYLIEILAMNGIADQVIQLRTSSVGGANCLANQLTVTKRKTILEIGPGPPKTLVNQDWHEYFPCGAGK